MFWYFSVNSIPTTFQTYNNVQDEQKGGLDDFVFYNNKPSVS